MGACRETLMAGDLSSILAALQNATTAINNLNRQLAATFPQSGTVSVAARGSNGTVVYNSSLATGFLPVTTSSGVIGYVALYPSS